MKYIIKKIVFSFCNKLLCYAEQYRRELIYEKNNIYPSVRLDDVEIIGNVVIGEKTYINKGSVLSSGENSKVVIGKYCAIGRYVHISSKTHTLELPTADEKNQLHDHVESDVTIGDYVWIGDKVYVREGVNVGDYAIIGANSVVLNDIKPFEIVGGVPAKHIRYNKKHYRFNN